jgi:hypothetical protein
VRGDLVPDVEHNLELHTTTVLGVGVSYILTTTAVTVAYPESWPPKTACGWMTGKPEVESQLAITGVAVEKLVFCTNSLNYGDRNVFPAGTNRL